MTAALDLESFALLQGLADGFFDAFEAGEPDDEATFAANLAAILRRPHLVYARKHAPEISLDACLASIPSFRIDQ